MESSDHNDTKIAIVEDNPNDAELITRVLKKLGLTENLILLKDGAEALNYLLGEGSYAQRAPNDAPGVILLDLKLPKVGGIEVLRKIKADERTKKIPVVVLTSSSEERDLRDAYDLGVNSYVTKPIKYDEFYKVVSDLGLYWLVRNKQVQRQQPG